MINALQQLADAGVAVWLDDLSRTQIQSGKLAKLAEHGGVVGVTTTRRFSRRRSGLAPAMRTRCTTSH
jgi:hypothetical protein